MFSMFNKVSNDQEVVLQDLTEEQLTQAAGGCYYGHKEHKYEHEHKHHHHHHHHHHNMMMKKNHNGFIEEKIVTTTKTIFVPANQGKW